MLLELPRETLMVLALTSAMISALCFAAAAATGTAQRDRGRRNPARARVGEDAYLADIMFAAESDRRAADAALDMLLDQVYGVGRWTHWETDRRDRSVHVWGVELSHDAAVALACAGFATVIQHEHDYGEFRRCTCGRELAELRVAA